MSTSFLGLPNVLYRKSAVITTVGPEPVAGDAQSYLGDEQISTTARITSYLPYESKWNIRTTGDTFDFGGFALTNINLSDNAYFRAFGGSIELRTLNPNQIISSNNVTGAVSDVNEFIGNASTTYISPTVTTSPWDVTLAFPNMNADVKTGVAMGQILLKMTNSGTPANVYPTINVELRESGSLIQVLGKKAVSETGDQIFVYTFNPGVLSTQARMQNLEIKVLGYPGDNGSYTRLNNLTVLGESAVPSVTPTFDTGYISANQAVFTSLQDGVLPTKSVHYLKEGNPIPNVDFVDIMIIDDGTYLNPPNGVKWGAQYSDSASVIGLPLRPSGYIEVGEPFIGPRLTVSPGLIYDEGDPVISVLTVSQGGTSQLGQSFSADSYTTRGLGKPLYLYCKRPTMMELMTKIGWQKGSERPFYVVIEDDLESKYQLFSSFPCVVKSISAQYTTVGRVAGPRDDDMFVVILELVEKV